MSARIMHFDRNGLEVLAREECLELLGSAVLGRIAINSGGVPVILPVNYLLDGERILIRTTPGTKLQAATADAVVAFEVDSIDRVAHTGWSVSATGVAREVTDPEDLARIDRLPLAHWAGNAPTHVIAISLDLLSGRRIRDDPRRV